MAELPTTMRAVAIDQYGGIEQMKVRSLPVPRVDAGEVLIKVRFAAVSVWDPIERQGYFDDIPVRRTVFPLVLGSEGAGEVVALGSGVTTRRIGEQVYATAFLNPKGGFYAEYVAVKADLVFGLPKNLPMDQAAVVGGDGGTALRGLEDVLKVRPGEKVLIFGAGGGLGHLAVQIAKRLGAEVFGVASGQDGVDLALSIGADAAINGRSSDFLHAIRSFAPQGLDAALMTAGGDAANQALTLLKPTGRVAYPNGVEPAPQPPAGITAQAFDGNLDADLLARLDAIINRGPFTAHVAQTFPLAGAVEATEALQRHYLGKLALKVG